MGKYWTCDKEWESLHQVSGFGAMWDAKLWIRMDVGEEFCSGWAGWGCFACFLCYHPLLVWSHLRYLCGECWFPCVSESACMKEKKKYKKAFSLLCFVLCCSEKICASMWNTAFIVPYILFGRTADWFGCWRSHVTFYRSKLTSKSQVACVEAH